MFPWLSTILYNHSFQELSITYTMTDIMIPVTIDHFFLFFPTTMHYCPLLSIIWLASISSLFCMIIRYLKQTISDDPFWLSLIVLWCMIGDNGWWRIIDRWIDWWIDEWIDR